MLPNVDFNNTSSVAGFVRARYAAIFGPGDDAWIAVLFLEIEALFMGRNPSYAAIDVRYHNLRHTLMAAVCMADLLEGQHEAGGEAQMTRRDFELAMAGVLLHDTGYLKMRGDSEGTGAKYTFCHIIRSCAFAASYLPQLGATDLEVENVLAAINCTGPHSDINRLRFRDPVSRLIGCALATSDYLGQLADPDYPEKLGALYAEFQESDDYTHVPPERRVFKSEEDLVSRTPGFWVHFVKPKLDNEFQAVYRYLERPLGSGHNPYLDAVEDNLAKIELRIPSTQAQT